jgi:hypothetical protein
MLGRTLATSSFLVLGLLLFSAALDCHSGFYRRLCIDSIVGPSSLVFFRIISVRDITFRFY